MRALGRMTDEACGGRTQGSGAYPAVWGAPVVREVTVLRVWTILSYDTACAATLHGTRPRACLITCLLRYCTWDKFNKLIRHYSETQLLVTSDLYHPKRRARGPERTRERDIRTFHAMPTRLVLTTRPWAGRCEMRACLVASRAPSLGGRRVNQRHVDVAPRTSHEIATRSSRRQMTTGLSAHKYPGRRSVRRVTPEEVRSRRPPPAPPKGSTHLPHRSAVSRLSHARDEILSPPKLSSTNLGWCVNCCCTSPALHHSSRAKSSPVK